MFDILIVIGVGLFFSYWIYVGSREYGQRKLWRTWEERFAHRSIATLVAAFIAFLYAFAGNSEEDAAPTHDPPLTTRLKFFFGVFLFFFIPMLIGLWRGQEIAAKTEALKSNNHGKQ